jgi:hypothetical protein
MANIAQNSWTIAGWTLRQFANKPKTAAIAINPQPDLKRIERAGTIPIFTAR